MCIDFVMLYKTFPSLGALAVFHVEQWRCGQHATGDAARAVFLSTSLIFAGIGPV